VRQERGAILYTGKTYNSLENVAQFFGSAGLPFNANRPAASAPQLPRPPAFPPSHCPGRRRPKSAGVAKAPPRRAGTVVEHPKYGTGTVVRREGEGDDAKITVIFPRFGMKKLVEKYAG
jgi:DNA helicase-2/ATP-dependent DNA helicase PcrA